MRFREALGLTIRQIRTKQDYTQRAFAEEMGSEQSAWSKVERGEAGLHVERFLRACRILKMAPWTVTEMAEQMQRMANISETGPAKISCPQCGPQNSEVQDVKTTEGVVFMCSECDWEGWVKHQ